MKHLLKLGGMTPEEILHILDVADEYKRLHKDGVDPKDLQGKAVALVFAKNSTRTRTSLEVGIYQMGGLGTYLSAGDLQTCLLYTSGCRSKCSHARNLPVRPTPVCTSSTVSYTHLVSKKFRGIVCRWANRSLRISWVIRCAVRTMSWV